MTSQYGSDHIVETLRRLDIQYVAVNPGASYRGLHDSLVHAGAPELIMTLFEGVSIAVAHGYAKAAGKPMAAAVHSIVGLQHASMGIFNAWADQVPVMVLGGSGPADSGQRRPWIDWIHSVRWQGATVRDITKWDDEPASVATFPESLMRAHQRATALPAGPTYVAFDAALQEQAAPAADLSWVQPLSESTITAPRGDLEALADDVTNATYPVLIADMVGRSRQGYEALIELAELLAAPVIDLGARHNFPNTHWADRTDDRAGQLRQADVVLLLDVRDWRLATAEMNQRQRGFRPLVQPETTIHRIGLTEGEASGFIDRGSLFVGASSLVADTAVALPELVELVRERSGRVPAKRRERLQEDAARMAVGCPAPLDGSQHDPLTADDVAQAVWKAAEPHPWLLTNNGLRGAERRHWRMDRWNCQLGTNVGAGLGYGLGVSLGAGLAHRDDGTLVVNIQPEGDLLYTPSALWTAAHHRIPVLIVVANNGTYGQDRMHQALMAEMRDRDPSKASVGIDIDHPRVDLAKMAEAQGVEGIGPVKSRAELDAALQRAVRTVVGESRPVLVDVVIRPEDRTGS